MSKSQLLEDIFEVQEKDPDGKKFDKGALLSSAICKLLYMQSISTFYSYSLPDRSIFPMQCMHASMLPVHRLLKFEAPNRL